jgi:hypothetical protein
MYYATDENAVVLSRHYTFNGAYANKNAIHVYQCYGRFEPGDKLAEARRLHHTNEQRLAALKAEAQRLALEAKEP